MDPVNLSSSLSILHVTAPAEVGGLESVVRMLARGHRSMGHRVCVAGIVSPDSSARGFLDSLAGAGVEVIPIVLATRAYARERSAIARLCESLDPSVVHTHGYRSDVIDAGVARSMGIPVVTTVHGFTGGGLRNRIYERLQEHAFRRFDAVVAVSNPIARRLWGRGVPHAHVHVIPNAFDCALPVLDRGAARDVLGIPADQFVVGWVGRLSAEKGPDILVESMPALSISGVSASIVGGGPDEKGLRERAVRLGITRSIRWHGVVPAAGALFAAFDVLALSSRTEGVPITLLEAAAAGTPIVATRVGGVPDMLSDAEAILIPPGDSRSLAAAIEAVRSDPEAARSRAVAARSRIARDFALGPWLDRYESLYRTLAVERGGRAGRAGWRGKVEGAA